MACFIVPAAEAIVTTTVTKVMEKQVEKKEKLHVESGKLGKITEKMHWLNLMLGGGSFVLALEHIWHGELSFTFPFLTRLSADGGATMVLHEMATTGVMMAVVVTLVWLVLATITSLRETRTEFAGWLNRKAGTACLAVSGVVLMGIVDLLM